MALSQPGATTEVTGIADRWRIFLTAQDIVDTKFNESRAMAVDALRTASETISQLKEVSSHINSIDVNLVLPTIVPPDVGVFTEVKPTHPTINANFPNPPAESTEMQDAIAAKLLHDIQNGTPAIPDSVQTAIFEKDTERVALVLQDTIDRIRDAWAKTGFTLPNGMLATNISQAIIEHGNKRTDVSRDIAIKSFELSDTNTKFAIEHGIAFLLQRIQLYRVEVDAEIARINSIVQTYLGEVEAYKGTAQVFTALADVNMKQFTATLQYEIAKSTLTAKNAEISIENFRVVYGLRAEAMKAIGSINSQIVAGALAAVSAGAHISASDSASYNYSTNPSF